MIDLNHFHWFIICWIAVGIIAGLYLLRREAPYGRFSNTTWGPTVSNKVGWLTMELTVMVVFALSIPFRQFNWHTPATVMIALFFIHYIHRSLVYPFAIRTKGKKMPLVIMLSAVLFNTVNGSLLGIWFGRIAHYPADWYGTPAFISGSVLFAGGMLLNWKSDYYLISLRKPGETGYKLPQSGLFKLVASPNLLGELIEWTGFALLTWSLPALAFFVWSCANLIPRAIANRRWYRKQFPEYPIDRKRLIPYLW
jgi:protein-S-isoprenylcysteine O-methyltransferase Ste14